MYDYVFRSSNQEKMVSSTYVLWSVKADFLVPIALCAEMTRIRYRAQQCAISSRRAVGTVVVGAWMAAAYASLAGRESGAACELAGARMASEDRIVRRATKTRILKNVSRHARYLHRAMVMAVVGA